MKLASYLTKNRGKLSHRINSDDEFLQQIQRQLAEISHHIQHLQDRVRGETFEMEWLALHLHLSIMKTTIAERLERMSQPTTNEKHF